MVDRRDIPRAYAGQSSDQAIAAAIRWLTDQLQTVGGQPLLYAPGKRNLKDTGGPLLQLSERIPTATWRASATGGWFGGPVLAAWPDRVHLAEIDGDSRTRALCVIGWHENDTAAWLAAHSPAVLTGDAPATGTAPISDPVVVEGLKTLTVLANEANNLAGALDKRDAIDVLQRLHDAGHRYDAAAVYTWALRSGWSARGAERLREYAERISAGQRPRRGAPSALRPDIVDMWRADAVRGAETE